MEEITNCKLTIEFKNNKPVELIDLTKSLLSLSDEYNRFILKEGNKISDETKLYIKEIKTGSIITELITYAPYCLPFIEYSKIIFNFAAFLKDYYEALLGKKEGNFKDFEKKDYENFNNFIEPTAKENGSQFIFYTTGDNNKINVAFNSTEANAIQNNISKKQNSLKETISGLKEKVVLYWYQARNDLNSKAGDKSIIESISKNPVKTIIDDQRIKSEILSSLENPFNTAYLVDVKIETINDRPVIYNIVRLYEKFDK